MNNVEIILSVCIPTYNQKELLKNLLDELLKYKGEDLEIVVSDNASTDGTFEMLTKVNDPRLRIYRNQSNVDMYANSHIAWQKAVGKYRIFVKDRNYVYIDDVINFISYARKSNADVIVAIGAKRTIKELDFREKARLIWYLSDPGTCIYSARIFDRLKSKFEFENWSENDWLENSLAIQHYFWREILYSDEWCWYENARLSHNISDKKIANVKQHRQSNIPKRKFFFTPEGVLNTMYIILKNPYIEEQDYVDCVLGFYQEGMDRITYYYRHMVNNEYECIRYGYIPPKHINWRKVITEFEKQILEYLKNNKKYNSYLKKEIKVITKKTFRKFLFSVFLEKIVLIKNKFYNKPNL